MGTSNYINLFVPTQPMDNGVYMARQTNALPFDHGKEIRKRQSPTSLPPTALPSMSSLLPGENRSSREYFVAPPFPSPTHFSPSWNPPNSSWRTQPYVPQTPVAQTRNFHHMSFAQTSSLQGPSRSIARKLPDISDGLSQDGLASPKWDGTGNKREGLSYCRNASQLENQRSIPISGLLTDTRPLYKLSLRQQPIAARACGFGDRDRRVIDPPPILQLYIDDATATPEQIKAQLRNLAFSVVHCTLLDPDTHEEDVMMPGVTDKRQQRRLMGTLVASPFIGMDEFDVEGCFYTFPDLSVRTPGTYRLWFRLIVLDQAKMGPGNVVPVSTSMTSEPFQVYNAKEFGGMRPSSELTKRLKNQGCLISVKKGNARNTARSRESDDDSDDESLSALKKGKRSKQ